jgi:hypothetical protein
LWQVNWGGWRWREKSQAAGWLEVELPERLAVLFLKLVFYYYLLLLDLDFLHCLGEQEPDKSSVRELIPIWQAGCKLGSTQYVSPQQLASGGEEKWEADILDFPLAGALEPQALC